MQQKSEQPETYAGTDDGRTQKPVETVKRVGRTDSPVDVTNGQHQNIQDAGNVVRSNDYSSDRPKHEDQSVNVHPSEKNVTDTGRRDGKFVTESIPVVAPDVQQKSEQPEIYVSTNEDRTQKPVETVKRVGRTDSPVDVTNGQHQGEQNIKNNINIASGTGREKEVETIPGSSTNERNSGDGFKNESKTPASAKLNENRFVADSIIKPKTNPKSIQALNSGAKKEEEDVLNPTDSGDSKKYVGTSYDVTGQIDVLADSRREVSVSAALLKPDKSPEKSDGISTKQNDKSFDLDKAPKNRIGDSKKEYVGSLETPGKPHSKMSSGNKNEPQIVSNHDGVHEVHNRTDKAKQSVKKGSGLTTVTAVTAAVLAARAAKEKQKKVENVYPENIGELDSRDINAFAAAIKNADGKSSITGKEIADSYSLASQKDAETILSEINQAGDGSTHVSQFQHISGTDFNDSFGIIPNNAEFRRMLNENKGGSELKVGDVGAFVTKRGNQVDVTLNGKTKSFSIRSDGTVVIDGTLMYVYAVDDNTVFLGWKNSIIKEQSVLTRTGVEMPILRNGSVNSGICDLTLKITHITTAKPITNESNISFAQSIKRPVIEDNFEQHGSHFIVDKKIATDSGKKVDRIIPKKALHRLIMKQKMVANSVMRTSAMAAAYVAMHKITDSEQNVSILVENFDRILASNCKGSAHQFAAMVKVLESNHLSELELEALFNAREQLRELGLTTDVETLKSVMKSGGLKNEVSSAIADYINIYDSTRMRIVKNGILSYGGAAAGMGVEHAFYAASMPYLLQSKGLGTDKKTLKKLLKRGSLSEENRKLIKNYFRYLRAIQLVTFSKNTLKAIAKGAVRTAKKGYRTAKSLANRYMGNDYTMRGLLMLLGVMEAPMKAYRTAKRTRAVIRNGARLAHASLGAVRATGRAAITGGKAAASAARAGANAAKAGASLVRRHGLKKSTKLGAKKAKKKLSKAASKGAAKAKKKAFAAVKDAGKAFVTTIIRLLKMLASALLGLLGPLLFAVIIILIVVFTIFAFLQNDASDAYYDAGDEDTAEVAQELVDVLTLCHASFRSALSNQFGGGAGGGSASGTDGSALNAPQMQKGDTSKVEGLYDVTEGTWWNNEGNIDGISWAYDCKTIYDKLNSEGVLKSSGGYAVAKYEDKTVFLVAMGSYWGKDGDVLKVTFNQPIALGNEPESTEIYVLKFDEKAWKDTGYPEQKEGLYGHPFGGHRDFLEFLAKDSSGGANMNGKGYMPQTATNLGNILDGSCDLATIGSGGMASTTSVNADIFYRQEIDQNVYRDILDRDNNIYYTFPKEQEMPDGISPTPTPVGYVQSTAKGEVYGFYNNDQELISMVLAMFDFDINSSTSTKHTTIVKRDDSGYDEAKAETAYQKGMTDKVNSDTWNLILYLRQYGLDLTNYQQGGYDDLKYSALVGLFNASHIVTGRKIIEYHQGPDGLPTYDSDGKPGDETNEDGLTYQVPVMETITNEDGSIETRVKHDADGDIVYETKYAPCPGHTKYSAAVITLHFDALLDMKTWWQKNIYNVDDFDTENPNYSSDKPEDDNYREKENVLKNVFQYIKKPDFKKGISGTCNGSGSQTTSGSFDPGTLTESQKEVAQKVFDFLTKEMSRKMSDEQAIGVLVNIYRECEFDYTQVENGGGGYGLTQWTGSRREKLVQWCNANGYKYNTLEGQLKMLENEFTVDTSDWTSSVDGFYMCADARSAGIYFIDYYERPRQDCRDDRVANMDGDILAVKSILSN